MSHSLDGAQLGCSVRPPPEMGFSGLTLPLENRGEIHVDLVAGLQRGRTGITRGVLKIRKPGRFFPGKQACPERMRIAEVTRPEGLTIPPRFLPVGSCLAGGRLDGTVDGQFAVPWDLEFALAFQGQNHGDRRALGIGLR
jgi:hypothetical protein